MKVLLAANILERINEEIYNFDNFSIIKQRGVKGHNCYGYRFVNCDYRENYHKIKISKKIGRKIQEYNKLKYPVQHWISKNNKKLTIAYIPDNVLVELSNNNQEKLYSYQESIKWINNNYWHCSFDKFSRRCHNNATALKRELRRYLRVDDQPLVEIDITCSQPFHLALEAQREKIEGVNDFLNACRNDLYQILAHESEISRSEAKEQFVMRALFSNNNSKNQKLPAYKAFEKLFPAMHQWITKLKSGKITPKNKKPWNKLAKLAQKNEANMIIYTICDEIRKEHPGIFVLPIHDSLLCLSTNVDYVKDKIINDYQTKYNTTPKLKIKSN